MIDYQKIYRTGVLVPDLSAAMEKYGKAVQVTWRALSSKMGSGCGLMNVAKSTSS